MNRGRATWCVMGLNPKDKAVVTYCGDGGGYQTRICWRNMETDKPGAEIFRIIWASRQGVLDLRRHLDDVLALWPAEEGGTADENVDV